MTARKATHHAWRRLCASLGPGEARAIGEDIALLIDRNEEMGYAEVITWALECGDADDLWHTEYPDADHTDPEHTDAADGYCVDCALVDVMVPVTLLFRAPADHDPDDLRRFVENVFEHGTIRDVFAAAIDGADRDPLAYDGYIVPGPLT